jgi:hypothetical protein
MVVAVESIALLPLSTTFTCFAAVARLLGLGA